MRKQLVRSGKYRRRKRLGSVLQQQKSRIALEALFKQGCSNAAELAKQTGVAMRTVQRNLKKFRQGATAERKLKSGRPTIFNSNDFRRLAQTAAKNGACSAGELAQKVSAKHMTPMVSRVTICRYLKRMGMKKRRPIGKVALTDKQKLARWKWCKKYRFWDFSKIWFSDETVLRIEFGRVRKWCFKRRRPQFAAKKVRTVMLWAAISDRGLTDFAIIRGSINTNIYTAVIHKYLTATADALYPDGWWFQQDNARPHVSKAAKSYFVSSRIRIIEWPPYSPDLSPIENLWAILKQELAKQQCNSIEEIIASVGRIWHNYDAEVSSRFMQTMDWRIERCLQTAGNIVDLNDMRR